MLTYWPAAAIIKPSLSTKFWIWLQLKKIIIYSIHEGSFVDPFKPLRSRDDPPNSQVLYRMKITNYKRKNLLKSHFLCLKIPYYQRIVPPSGIKRVNEETSVNINIIFNCINPSQNVGKKIKLIFFNFIWFWLK